MHPCASDNYVTTVPRYAHVQAEMLTLCGTEVGTVQNYNFLPNLIDSMVNIDVQLVMNVGWWTFQMYYMV